MQIYYLVDIELEEISHWPDLGIYDIVCSGYLPPINMLT